MSTDNNLTRLMNPEFFRHPWRRIFATKKKVRGHILHLMLLACIVQVLGVQTAYSSPAVASADHREHEDELPPIVVNPGEDLGAILTAANAGRKIRLVAGDFVVTQTLFVPDGATLEGAGSMRFNDSLPAGFSGNTSRLISAAGLVGDIIRLGHGATVRRVLIEDVPRPANTRGNLIGIMSRAPGDVLAATIDSCELINPNSSSIVADGPGGRAVAVVVLNLMSGTNPPPHDGATISAILKRSLIHSPGGGDGVFAIAFASDSLISLKLERNVIGGGLSATGGVSRPDAVHDSDVFIRSKQNLYVSDQQSGASPAGWQLIGGASPPVPPALFVAGASSRNSLILDSVRDRIEGFDTAVFAIGSRRSFVQHGLSSGHLADLRVRNLQMTSNVVDLRLLGIRSDDVDVAPGNDNTLRVDLRGVTGSGPRDNVYLVASGPIGPLSDEGSDNRLEFVGSLRKFEHRNDAIDPAPPAMLFTSDH